MNEEYSIHDLVKKTGLTRRTIYFYTQQGILPPPEGAGLGAYYTDVHLMRLQLIPFFRQKGLRLDDIREKFEQMDVDALKQHCNQVDEVVLTQPQKISGQNYLHYSLPGGIILIVPSPVNQKNREKIIELLETAHRIFGADAPPIQTQ